MHFSLKMGFTKGVNAADYDADLVTKLFQSMDQSWRKESLYAYIASLSFFPGFGGFSIALKNTFADLIDKFIA